MRTLIDYGIKVVVCVIVALVVVGIFYSVAFAAACLLRMVIGG